MATASKKKPGKAPAASARGRRGTGAAGVYTQMRDDILSLKIAPGSLLDETELADRFKLSRSPVREAMIRLSAEGLIQMLPNRSPMVTPFDIAEVPCHFDALELMYRATCRLAAQYRTEADLKALLETQKAIVAAAKRNDTTTQLQLNRDFHLQIAHAGRNPVYASWLKALLDHGQRLLRLSVFFQGGHTRRDQLSYHDAILSAIRKQDVDAAEEAAQSDVDVLRRQFLLELSARPTSEMKIPTPRR